MCKRDKSDKQTEGELWGQNLKFYSYVCVQEAMCLYLNPWREIVTGDENAALSEILPIQSKQDWAPESTVCYKESWDKIIQIPFFQIRKTVKAQFPTVQLSPAACSGLFSVDQSLN